MAALLDWCHPLPCHPLLNELLDWCPPSPPSPRSTATDVFNAFHAGTSTSYLKDFEIGVIDRESSSPALQPTAKQVKSPWQTLNSRLALLLSAVQAPTPLKFRHGSTRGGAIRRTGRGLDPDLDNVLGLLVAGCFRGGVP